MGSWQVEGRVCAIAPRRFLRLKPRPCPLGAKRGRAFAVLITELQSLSTMSSIAAQGLVLVVDDQPRNLEMVKTVLARDGFEVMTAEDAATALKWLSGRLPDLVLLDVIMPDMNGFDLCGRIKENPAWKDIPVIFLSGDDHQGSIRTGFRVGGVDYITKPFNKEELLARVRTHVQLRRAHERHAAQLMERNRVLNLIANEWHRPLQRIVLNMARMKDLCGATDAEMVGVLADEAMSAERMLASVETFLQLRSVENDGKRPPEETFTSHELGELVGNWYTTAKRKPVEMRLNGSSKVIPLAGVRFMGRQIVDAVLSNAIGHTPSGGRVTVRIAPEGEGVTLQVFNEGPGFPEEYLQRPFHPYLRRGTERGRRVAALGIGLAVAKRAADRIGATITIGNHANGGGLVKVEFAPKMRMALRV